MISCLQIYLRGWTIGWYLVWDSIGMLKFQTPGSPCFQHFNRVTFPRLGLVCECWFGCLTPVEPFHQSCSAGEKIVCDQPRSASQPADLRFGWGADPAPLVKGKGEGRVKVRADSMSGKFATYFRWFPLPNLFRTTWFCASFEWGSESIYSHYQGLLTSRFGLMRWPCRQTDFDCGTRKDSRFWGTKNC